MNTVKMNERTMAVEAVTRPRSIEDEGDDEDDNAVSSSMGGVDEMAR